MKKRKKKFGTRHHLIPRSRGGKNEIGNLLLLWDNKHEMRYILFGNHTLNEIINLLIEVKKRKSRQGLS